METILCSRILQIVSTKYLIYTRECLKLINEVIKFINFYAIRYYTRSYYRKESAAFTSKALGIDYTNKLRLFKF
jgi:hypothetical protein